MKNLKRVLFLMFLAAFSFACLCGCGTVTTDEANEYLDEDSAVESGGGNAGECTISIDCKTVLDNMPSLNSDKKGIIPEDGVILPETTVSFEEGDSVLDILKKVTMDNKMQMEFEDSPAYDGGYVNGICNLYEFDCGDLSGWKYFVNDWNPNYGCNNYIVQDGDVIAWRYTCDSGEDLK